MPGPEGLGFLGSNISAHGLELLGPLAALGAVEHVFGGDQLHIDQTGARDRIQVLSLQESAADSSGPEVYFLSDLI